MSEHKDGILQKKLSDDLKEAMRTRDKARLRTIRSVLSALKEKEIELRGKGDGLTEQTEQSVLQKQAKQRRDAIGQYESAGRQDLVDKEREELSIIDSYLPKQLEDAEIRNVVLDIIQSTGATSKRDMGKVMGVSMKNMSGKADGRRVQQIVSMLLTEMESPD